VPRLPRVAPRSPAAVAAIAARRRAGQDAVSGAWVRFGCRLDRAARDCPGPTRGLRPLPGARHPWGGWLRRRLPRPRYPARPARGHQGAARRSQPGAGRGRTGPAGGATARPATSPRHRGGPRRGHARGAGLHRLRLSRWLRSRSLVARAPPGLAGGGPDRGGCRRRPSPRPRPPHHPPRRQAREHPIGEWWSSEC
jgi:hypothetical protein